ACTADSAAIERMPARTRAFIDLDMTLNLICWVVIAFAIGTGHMPERDAVRMGNGSLYWRFDSLCFAFLASIPHRQQDLRDPSLHLRKGLLRLERHGLDFCKR